jgi:hypothetical protein
MLRIAALVLAFFPLLGVGWIVLYGSPTTVDGLFLILILLAISAILGGTGLYGVYKSVRGEKPAVMAAKLPDGMQIQRGHVEDVVFYEAEVGHPNKSLVTLSEGSSPFKLLVFEGDVRNVLPVGQTVEITFQKGSGYNILGRVIYA